MDRGRIYAIVVAVVVWFGIGLAGVALFGQAHAHTGRRLSVRSVGDSQVTGTVVAAGSMSGAERDVFERALSNDTHSTPVPATVDTDVWQRAHYVRYQNHTYRVTVVSGS